MIIKYQIINYVITLITKFENNTVSLMEIMFRTYFENAKSNYSMRVKYEGSFIILILLILN